MCLNQGPDPFAKRFFMHLSFGTHYYKKNDFFYQSICLDYLKIPQVAILGDLHV
jgi:hypothetical protein